MVRPPAALPYSLLYRSRGWLPAGPTFPTQTITPARLTIAVNGTYTFTTNEPAVWSTTGGSLVVAADQLSAVFTAPAAPASIQITVVGITSGSSAVAFVEVVVMAFWQFYVMRCPSGLDFTTKTYGAGTPLQLLNPLSNRVYKIQAQVVDMQSAQPGDLVFLKVRRNGADATSTVIGSESLISVSVEYGTK